MSMEEEAQQSIRNMTALMWAAAGGSAAEVRKLLKAGADPNEADKRSKFTALHWSVSLKGNPMTIRALIDGGANPDARDKDGQTPLHHAVLISGDARAVKVIKALRDNGADPDIPDKKYKRSPLLLAAYSGKMVVMKVLLQLGADLYFQDKAGDDAWNIAAEYEGDREQVTKLLDCWADKHVHA